MNKKTVSGTMLTMFLILAFSITCRDVSATETQGTTILTITNSDSPPVSSSTVYWWFQIIAPHKEAVPGEIVQYSMRVTNFAASDTPLQFFAIVVSFDPPLPWDYGSWSFNFEWPTVGIGETYEGPFGYFTWTNNVPIGYVQGGFMGASVTDGSPPFQDTSYTVTIVAVEAAIDINPDRLNLKSKGKWATAYIQLPEEYNAEDIDATTVLLNDTVQPILDPKYDFVTKSSEYIVDHNEDGILERMVKFNRAEVMALLSVGEATLTVTGEVNGTPFEGSDTIRVIG